MTVFITPRRIRNSLFSIFIISEPITAAWLLPRAGRKEQRGAEIIPAIDESSNSFFDIFRKVISWFGIFVFLIIEVISEEEPNKPVSKGSKESFNCRFKVDRPKKPDNKKTKRAEKLFSLKRR